MSRAMRHVCVLCASFLLFSAWRAYPGYALTSMDDEGMKAAIEYGKSRDIGDIVNDPEWTRPGPGGTYATLVSAFKIVALKTAEAKSQGREFTLDDARAICRSTPGPKTLGAQDLLVFFTIASGNSEEDCMNFSAELQQGAARVNPIEKEIELPVKSPAGRFYARCRAYFPIAGVDAGKPAAFVTKGPAGEAWSYEFDLAKIR